MGFRVLGLEWGLGCGVWGVRCGVWGVRCGVWGVGCGVWGVGCGVWGVGYEIYDDNLTKKGIHSGSFLAENFLVPGPGFE